MPSTYGVPGSDPRVTAPQTVPGGRFHGSGAPLLYLLGDPLWAKWFLGRSSREGTHEWRPTHMQYNVQPSERYRCNPLKGYVTPQGSDLRPGESADCSGRRRWRPRLV